MRYPINQQSVPISEELQPFLVLGQMLHVDPLTDTFRLECPARGIDRTYSVGELNAVHPRLAETACKAHAVMKHPKTAFAVVRQNIRCWHQAVTLSTSYGEGYRYFFETFHSIEIDHTSTRMAIIRGKSFATENQERQDFVLDSAREGVHVVSYGTKGVDFTWDDLERYWPGIIEQIRMCEDLGMDPMETAQHCLLGEPGRAHVSPLSLPDSLTYDD